MRRAGLVGIALLSATAWAADGKPVFDVHLHAMHADAHGPPPLGMCTPFDPFPAWDQRVDYGAVFIGLFKKPPCRNPVWSPRTDQELMRQTLKAMERLHVVGVVSGPQDLVSTWMDAARQTGVG